MCLLSAIQDLLSQPIAEPDPERQKDDSKSKIGHYYQAISGRVTNHRSGRVVPAEDVEHPHDECIGADRAAKRDQ